MKAFRANLAKNNLHLIEPAPEDQTTLQFSPTSVLYCTADTDTDEDAEDWLRQDPPGLDDSSPPMWLADYSELDF